MMMNTTDRPFDPPAPEGYEVREVASFEDDACRMCAFLDDRETCSSRRCNPEDRPDGRWVYFTRAVPAKDAA